MSNYAGAGETSTTVRNGNNIATITQSGDRATTVRKVVKRPGYTRIEQKSGNNSSVIVQSSGPVAMPHMDDKFSREFLENLPPEMRDFFQK
jgi:hypothetical protein